MSAKLPVLNPAGVPVVSADYLRTFKCIGAECEDNCCVGWTNISVDKETYALYREVKSGPLAERLAADIVPNEGAGEHEAPMRIKMNAQRSCPFLRKDRLCDIQCGLGESHLSTTCSMYPRALNFVRGAIERSANLSCPEAARLALLNPRGMSFEVDDALPHRAQQLSLYIPDIHDPNDPSPRHRFWEMRKFALSIIQDRSIRLPQRLLLLGKFLLEVQEVVGQPDWHPFDTIAERYVEGAREALVAELPQPDSRTSALAQLSTLRALLLLAQERGTSSLRFSECLQEAVKGLDQFSTQHDEQLIPNCRRAIGNYFQPFMAKHGYVLENYLANQIFKNLFPLGSQPSLFEEYLALMTPYLAIQAMLIGIGSQQREIPLTAVVKVVQSFTKTFEHNPVAMKALRERLYGEQIPSLADLAAGVAP